MKPSHRIPLFRAVASRISLQPHRLCTTYMREESCISEPKILQPANIVAHPLQMQQKPFSNTGPPANLHFNGTTFGIWLWHRVLKYTLATQFWPSLMQQHAPPNFLGSHRLLSATNSVRSYWTSACFNVFLLCSSTNFW